MGVLPNLPPHGKQDVFKRQLGWSKRLSTHCRNETG